MLSSCGTNSANQQQERQNRYGWQGTQNPDGTQFQEPPTEEMTDDGTGTENAADQGTDATNATNTVATDGTQTAEPETKNYPYATPVPGKAGFVTSPHAPYSGYVDVRGFPPGTEVKDPYTGKIFLVP